MATFKAELAFKTASGKTIAVDPKALEAARLKMKNEEPGEASLALSQTFLPSSMTRALKKDIAGSKKGFQPPGKSSAALVDWTDGDSVHFTAKTVYPPAHQLQDRKHLVSHCAFSEMIRKKAEASAVAFQGTANSNLWTLSRADMEQTTLETNDDVGILETDMVMKTTGVDATGAPVRVLVSRKHGMIEFGAGKTYILCGFEKNSNGGTLELKSTNDISVIPVTGIPSDISPELPLQIRQIREKAATITTKVETSLVARIVDLIPNAQGQNVLVRDADGDEIKVKFLYAVEVEGVESIMKPGNVIAFSGLIIHHPITKLHGYLFANEFTAYFTEQLAPAHLREHFDLLNRSEREKMDVCEDDQKLTSKRASSTEDDSTESKKTRYL